MNYKQAIDGLHTMLLEMVDSFEADAESTNERTEKIECYKIAREYANVLRLMAYMRLTTDDMKEWGEHIRELESLIRFLAL